MTAALVPLVVLLPLLGAAIALILGRHRRAQIVVSTAVLAIGRRDRRGAARRGRLGRAGGRHGRRLGDPVRHRARRRPARRRSCSLDLGDRAARGAALLRRTGRRRPAIDETPVSIFHPSLPDPVGRRLQRVHRGRPVQPLRGLRDPAVGELRADHPRRHGRAHPHRRHVHRRRARLVALLPQRDRPDLRRPRHGEHGADLGAHGRAAAERAARPAPAAAHRVRHQGGGLPAVVLAARLVPDRARTGHRGVRRPAHEGRRLRDHPHRDGDLRRERRQRPAHGRRRPRR